MSRETHVLHIVDRVTGGVPAAVATYIQNSPPGYQHSVLSPFLNGTASSIWNGVDAKMLDLGDGHLSRIDRVRKTWRAERPEVVHAHSSFAGAYTRLALRRGGPRIVYTPHCFAFERQDIGRAERVAYRLAEWLFSLNTDILAACGQGEKLIADRLGPLRGRTIYVPNVASIESAAPQEWRDGPLRVAMLGRLTSQKDPDYFADLVRDLRARGIELEATWIGDGDSEPAARLARAGIRVTGWLPKHQVRTELAAQSVYLHTAAWEGFPLALLDAHACGVPMLCRGINALSDLPESLLIDHGYDGLVDAANSPVTFSAWARSIRESWEVYLADNSARGQMAALASAWSPTSERITK
ncbi:glycosyltransferase [Microbacterium aerolatum]|uniref:glycosyltransferase n=1 Tax=Microbacterium aerolatum TaxID=153731 RepID=UPI002000AE82|nr:glycosyltransferase [Microbacterium aerolatum]MCK3769764.1 glycosyltransferase [Microbacterium aerolatum]